MAGTSGNSGGKRAGAGRKPKGDEAELQSILAAGWPRADRIAAVKKLAERANKGDMKAAQFLFDRGYGKPKEKHELSGPEGDPIPIGYRYVTSPPPAPNQPPDERPGGDR